MRKLLLASLLFTLSLAGSAFATVVDDVVILQRQGVSKDVMTAWIERQPRGYRITPDDLVRLRSENVPDSVVVELLRNGDYTVRHSGSEVAVNTAPTSSYITNPVVTDATTVVSPAYTTVYTDTPVYTYAPYYSSYRYPYYGYGYGSGLYLNFGFGHSGHYYGNHYYGNHYYGNHYNSGSHYYGNSNGYRGGSGTGYTYGRATSSPRYYSGSSSTFRSTGSRSYSGYSSGRSSYSGSHSFSGGGGRHR